MNLKLNIQLFAGEGLLSKGIKLSYKSSGSTFIEIPDLQEVPDLGGEPDKVEVTTLADSARRYIKGIKEYGDLAFKFLYDNTGPDSSYRILRGLEESDSIVDFKVDIPDGTSFAFKASVSTKIDSAGVNAPLTFTATLTLNSDMEVTNPTTGG